MGLLIRRSQIASFPHRCCSGSATGAGSSEAKPAQTQSAERPKVPPLTLDKKMVVYKSPVDLDAVVASARQQCVIGSAACLFGFLAIIAGSPTHPPALHSLVSVGVGMMGFKNLVATKREFANIGLSHIHSISILPTPVSSATKATKGAEGADAAAEAAAGTEASGSFSVADRFEATHELTVEVKTASTVFRLDVRSPHSGWDNKQYSGLVSDDRPPLPRVFDKFYLSEVKGWGKDELGNRTSEDTALLEALLSTDKVVEDYECERRPDLAKGSLFEPADEPKQSFRSVMDKASTKKSSTEMAMDQIGLPKTASIELGQVGRQTLISGMIFFTAGMAFLMQWSAGKASPQKGKEGAGMHDLVDVWKARFEEIAADVERAKARTPTPAPVTSSSDGAAPQTR